MSINRRVFIRTVVATASALPLVGQRGSEWGGAVVDCHHHMRRTPEANIAHLDGSGISNAMLLARDNSAGEVAAWKTRYPGRVLGWFAAADITKPEAGNS